ncbi:MAG: helix-turn-helix domain-containing protein [Bacteroidota bacterium]|nr:helix-turn-helix domain-containing protein [Bacteroidota bacterium]
MTKKLAEELKEARLKKDITLQQLFAKTRIDIKFLEAIENGNFEVLPDVYLREFVKSYASAVGLDETTIMKKFDASKSGKDFDEKHGSEKHTSEKHVSDRHISEPRPSIKEEKPRPEPIRSERKKEYISPYDSTNQDNPEEPITIKNPKANLIWIALAGVLLIVALLLYLIFFRGSSTQIITEKPYEEYLDKNSQRFEDTTAKASGQNSAKKDSLNRQNTSMRPDSLSLLVKSTAKSWVKITADDNAKTFEFVLPANSQKYIKAKKNFTLIVGNSGAVELQLNNSPLNLNGKTGEVRVAKIDSSGLVYSRASRPAAPKTTTPKAETSKTTTP